MSVAERLTTTGPLYELVEQDDPPQEMLEVGAVVSNWISCDFVVSTLPALSQARYLTVVAAETVNGAE